MKYIICLLTAIITLTYTTKGQAQTQPPENRYPIYFTLNQIQVIVTSIQSPDDVSKNAKQNVLNEIISQANAALIPPKKDSTTKTSK